MIPIKYKAARFAGTIQAAGRCEGFSSHIHTPILARNKPVVYIVDSGGEA